MKIFGLSCVFRTVVYLCCTCFVLFGSGSADFVLFEAAPLLRGLTHKLQSLEEHATLLCRLGVISLIPLRLPHSSEANETVFFGPGTALETWTSPIWKASPLICGVQGRSEPFRQGFRSMKRSWSLEILQQPHITREALF